MPRRSVELAESGTFGSEMPGHSGSVLIVDDDPSVGRLLKRILERRGFHCRVCQSAAAARRILKEETAFDLLLSDIRMPGESGIDLVRFVHNTFPATSGRR